MAAIFAALGLAVVAVGPRTGMWPARLGGPGGEDAAGDGTAVDAANTAQIGEVTDDPVEVPPDIEIGPADADLLQRAENASGAEPPETTKLTEDGGVAVDAPVADPDTLLVQFDDGASSDEIAAALDDAGIEGTPIDGIAVAEVQLDGRDADEVEAAFEEDPLFTGTEPNLVRSATAIPNDPQLPNQRDALDTIRVPGAWDVADGGANVTVAVIDTGIDLDHPDLKPNLVAGRDIVNGDNSPGDDAGHGTMTAGLIGARTNNGIAIAGVAWNAKIMPIKVLDSEGFGTDADVANGIIWATDHGAKVINLSLGGPGTSATLDNAVRYARNRDVLLVAASGNGASTELQYPAAAPGVIAVSATDDQGRFAWFSDHGPWVSLAAPGIDVRTTALAPGAAAAVDDGTGTSFASPLVAGVAALIRERHPAWPASRVASQLIRTARDAGPTGVDNAYGYGIVDATAALGVGPKAPVAPPPDLASDADNFYTSPRQIPTGTAVSETLDYEFDEDWFAFDVAAAGTAEITVTGTPFLPDPQTRAHEIDPVIELYAPTGLRVGEVIDGDFFDSFETGTRPVSAGRYLLRIRSWLGSAAEGPYQLEVDLSSSAAAAATSWTAAAVDDMRGDPAVGDFDADGDADVATGSDDTIAVAWNEGGELSAPESYPATGASSLVATDLDGASARPTTELVGTTDVWRWSGDGFTATPLGFDRGTPAAAGDVTGDGLADVVDVTDGVEGTVRVHAQQAGATWADPIDVAIAPLTTVGALAVGDVSGDDLADLVVTGTDAGGTSRVVRSLQAGGTLGAATALPPAGDAGAATAAAIGDVDGDDRNDVVVLHEGKVGAYTQDAAGHLGDETVLPAPDAPAGTAATTLADLDGDGHGDLVATGTAGAVAVLEQQFTAAVLPASRALTIASTSPAPFATGVATSVRPSVTFSATPDAATVNTTNVALVDGRTGARVAGSVATSGATVTFTPSAALAAGAPYRLAVSGVTLANRRNTASGDFPFVTADGPAPTFAVNETYTPLSLDFDGNGFDDVFWYAPGTASDALWRMGPNGRTSVPVAVNGTYTPLTGDFDGNGYDDIFWYAPGAGADSIWYSGPGGFTSRTMPVGGTYRPVVGDVDRNGYDDIFWYGPGSAPDTLWRFGPLGKTDTSIPVSGTSFTPFAGDFNRDGFDDVLWHGPGLTTVSLWRGGSTPFATRLTTTGLGADWNARPLDSDGDGDDDIYWFRDGDGELWRSGAGGFTPQDGPALPGTARPVTGEFTGDLRDDLLGYVPGTTADQLYRGSDGGLG